MRQTIFKKWLKPSSRSLAVFSKISLVILVASLFSGFSQTAMAANITSLSDNLSRLKTGTLADHEIKFLTPSGIAAGQTVTLTFGAAFTMGSFAVNNVDFATSTTATCSSATYNETTLAASPSGLTWGVAQAGQVITLTSGTATASANTCVRVRIGANAVVGGAGTSQITNGSAGATTATVAVAGTFGDSGTLFVPIITNDQVTITATVNPSISFSISTNSIGFGTLTSANAVFATSDSLGTTTTSTAHTLIAGTNASSGYSIYVSGATLTSAGNTIAAIGASAASSTPGSAQFGIALSASGGSGTTVTPYNFYPSSWAEGFSSTTQAQIAQASGPSNNTTYSVSYIANISPVTPAGAYSTILTYTATGSY